MSQDRFATVVGGRPGSRRSQSLDLSEPVRSFLGRLLDEAQFRTDFLADPDGILRAQHELDEADRQLLATIDPARVRMLDRMVPRQGATMKVLAAGIAAAAIFLGLQNVNARNLTPADKMERPGGEYSLVPLSLPEETGEILIAADATDEVGLGTDEARLTGSINLQNTATVQLRPRPRPEPHPIAPGSIRPDIGPWDRPEISRGIRPDLNLEGGHRPRLPEIPRPPAGTGIRPGSETPVDDGRFVPLTGIRPDLEDADLVPIPDEPDGN